MIYLSHVPEDVGRWEKYAREADQYLPGGRGTVKLINGVDATLWPHAGGYNEAAAWVKRYLEPNPKFGAQDKPEWWRDWQYEMPFTRVDAQGRSIDLGRLHHVGCGLAHFSAWMSARDRGVEPILVTESDGGPAAFTYSGYPQEYAAVVVATLQSAPPNWDLIYLDKCTRGTEGGPILTMSGPGWQQPYSLYRWRGNGQAGLSMYLASGHFLLHITDIIFQTGFDMVDAWLGNLCKAGTLDCYSICAADVASRGGP